MKTPDRNLRQENAPAFDVGKEALDDAVAKTDQHQVLYALRDFLIKQVRSLLEHIT